MWGFFMTKALTIKKNKCICFKCHTMHEIWAWALLFFLLLSWFDVSLFAKRINMTIRKCNALLKMSHMIAFDIVHVVRLYSNWEGELSSKRISSRLCYINFKTNAWNKTNRWEIVVKTWLLNRDYNLMVGLFMFTTLNCDYKCRYLDAKYLTFTLILWIEFRETIFVDCLIFQRLMGPKFRGITCMINLLKFVVDVNGSKFMDERINKIH